MFDIRSKFVFMRDVCSFAGSDNLNVVKTICGSCVLTEEPREKLPSSYVCILGTGWDTYQSNVRKIHHAHGMREFKSSPAAINITPIFEADNHPQYIQLLKSGTLLIPLWQIVV